MSFKQWIKGKMRGRSIGDFVEECQWALGYVVRFRGTVFVHVLLSVLGIVMTLLSSVATKILIDAVVGLNSGVIGSAVCLMIGARLTAILMRSVSHRIASKIDVRVQHDIQHEVFQCVLKTDWQSLEEYRSGDLLHRIGSDVNVISGGVTGFLPSLISCSVQLLGSFMIIFMCDHIMALIALCGVPLTVLCSGLFGRRMHTYNREMKEVSSDLLSFQQDALSNMTMIKSFGLSDHVENQLDVMHEKYREKYLEYNRFSVWTSAFMGVLSVAASMSCFLWAVYRLWQGTMTYGDLTMFLQLAGMLGSSFSTMVSLVPSLISICTSARRIMNLAELPEEKAENIAGLSEEKAVHLDLKGISFEYQGGASVLADCDFVAYDGDLVAIGGPSGEGKTTLLRILLGLVTPSSGIASIVGGSGQVYALSASTRSLFGYVPQGNQMMNGTIRENLLMNGEASDEELLEVLRLSCAYDFVMELEDGLDHVIGGRDHRLSEGQVQRLAVARALLRRAPILLLDEATSALDLETEEKMLRNIMNSDAVRTCLFVTHRSFGRKLCTRTYELHDGKLIEVTHE